MRACRGAYGCASVTQDGRWMTSISTRNAHGKHPRHPSNSYPSTPRTHGSVNPGDSWITRDNYACYPGCFNGLDDVNAGAGPVLVCTFSPMKVLKSFKKRYLNLRASEFKFASRLLPAIPEEFKSASAKRAARSRAKRGDGQRV